MGFKGISFCGWPAGGEKPLPSEDPFWAACTEAGIAMTFVRGGPVGADRTPSARPQWIGPKGSHVRPNDKPNELLWANDAVIKNHNITYLIYAGVLERFPSFKIAIADAGAGWLPTHGELLDWLYRYERFIAFAQMPHMPHEYIKRNVRITYNGERSTLAARKDFSDKALMWSSNFPNHTSTWPSSRTAIEDQFAGIPEADRRRILGENCAELYSVTPKRAALALR
jgi:predicted TIM-barrel fold metal-dependent hydrolase